MPSCYRHWGAAFTVPSVLNCGQGLRITARVPMSPQKDNLIELDRLPAMFGTVLIESIKPHHVRAYLDECVRAWRDRRWREGVSGGGRRGIPERGHGMACDGFIACQQLGHARGLIRMQLAKFVQGARGRTAPCLHGRIEHRRQREQRYVMSDRGLVDCKPLGDGGIRFAGIDLAPVETRQFQRRQSVSLQVFGDLVVGVMFARRDDDWHFGESGLPGGPPSLAPEVDAVLAAFIGGANNNGLQDAALSDVLCEFVYVLRRELRARIARVFMKPVDRHHQRLARRHRLGVEQTWLIEGVQVG